MIAKALNINGWMSPSELEWLASVARISKVIVEFGCYEGRSTRALADNTRGIVYAVDPWTDEYFDKDGNKINCLNPGSLEKFYHNLSDHIDNGKVIPYRCKSDDFHLTYADFIFIDGDHRYEQVLKDLRKARRMMTKGIIAGHDYDHPDWPGVREAVDKEMGEIGRVGSIWIRRF